MSMENINIIDVVDYLDQETPFKRYVDQTNQDYDYEEKNLLKSYKNFLKFNFLEG